MTQDPVNEPVDVDVDDLDELLDNVLSDFSSLDKQKGKVAATESRQSQQPTSINQQENDTQDPSGDSFEAEFQKQLENGMESLFKELLSSAEGEDGLGAVPGIAGNESADLKAFLESLSKAAPPATSTSQTSSSNTSRPKQSPSTATPSTNPNLQSRISETLERLQSSSENVDTKISDTFDGPTDDIMEAMMKQMESLVDSKELDGMLEGMVESLMSKDILYEPMKDLANRYPTWLQENKEKCNAEEFEKYTAQHGYIQEIIAIYENNATLDDALNKKVADLMTKMQECGNPPTEILKEFAPDMEIGPDGAPKFPEMDPM